MPLDRRVLLCYSALAETPHTVADAAEPPSAAAAPATEAAPAADAAQPSAPEQAERTFIRVSKNSHPASVAAFVLRQLEERPDDGLRVSASGPSACLVAVKALAYARNMMLSSRRVAVEFKPQLYVSRVSAGQPGSSNGEAAGQAQAQDQGQEQSDGGEGAPAQRLLRSLTLWTSVAAVDPSDGDAAARPTEFRVGMKTNENALATAVTERASKGEAVQLSCLGSASLLVALRALSKARRSLIVGAEKDLAVAAEIDSSTVIPARQEAGAGDDEEHQGSGEGDDQGPGAAKTPVRVLLTVSTCEPRAGAAESIRRSNGRRRKGAGGRGGGRGVDRLQGGDVVAVPRAEWESVQQQLDLMAAQTEQLLQLLSQQKGQQGEKEQEGSA